MKFTTAATTAATLLVASVESRIIGVAVPDVIKPGAGFNAIIMTSNYIQSVDDLSIAFGYAPPGGWGGALGPVMGDYRLGPEQSNVLYNITKWVSVPSDAPKGDALITAALFSLYGASNNPTISNYNVSSVFGDYTSQNYVSSLYNSAQ